MDRPKKIMILEDMPSDAALTKRVVSRFFGECDFMVTDDKKEFIEGLSAFKPDIILSDYCMPGFDWLTAYKITRDQSPSVPFIIVTGSTNPKIAAECLKSGAMDFISKDYINTLGPAIESALKKQKEIT
jgi:DNA-binding NtrC family response regulator